LLGKEGATLRKTILPTIYYLVVVGVCGLIGIHLLGLGDGLILVGDP
jgi:lactate permease